jgi:hypothetical protein
VLPSFLSLGRDTSSAASWPCMPSGVYIRALSCGQSALSLRMRSHVQANCGVDGPRSCLVFCPVHQAATGVLARQRTALAPRVAGGIYTSPTSRCMQYWPRGTSLEPPEVSGLLLPRLPSVSLPFPSSQSLINPLTILPQTSGTPAAAPCCLLTSARRGGIAQSMKCFLQLRVRPLSVRASTDRAMQVVVWPGGGRCCKGAPIFRPIAMWMRGWAGTMMIVVHYTSSAKWIASSGSSGDEADDVWDPPKARCDPVFYGRWPVLLSRACPDRG